MNKVVNNANCPFCKTEGVSYWLVETAISLYGFNCSICKQYYISELLFNKIKDQKLSSSILNCIAENIENNSKTGEVTTSWHLDDETKLPTLDKNITVKRYEAFASSQIFHANKKTRLLLRLAENLGQSGPFEVARLSLMDLYQLKILDYKSEALRWLCELMREGFIESEVLSAFNKLGDGYVRNIDDFWAIITPKGWEEIFQQQKSLNSKKVFIAMQFYWDGDLAAVKNEFISAVKSGCRDCGYDAELVSDDEHIDQITDKIVSKIKSSRFVIADFTFNNRGAYYESGFARGLGIPVIHTVFRDHVNNIDNKEKSLHFDIRQINYLEWTNPSEVRARIADRIRAVIEC